MGRHTSQDRSIMIRNILVLFLFSSVLCAPAPKAATKKGIKAPCKDCSPVIAEDKEPVADRVEAEPAEAIDLMESEDEAIGDGIKEKFDVALNRIGEEIEGDQKEQFEESRRIEN